jgi:TctA family transporter
MSRGDFSIFVTRPIPAVIFGIAALLLIFPFFAKAKRSRIASLQEGD